MRHETQDGGRYRRHEGEEVVAAPAFWVKLPALIRLGKKRYQDTSIHSDGASHFTVTAS